MGKKIVILGATGRTGKYIVRHFQKMKDVELTLFVRNPAKLEGLDVSGASVVQGDALNALDVRKAVSGQEVILAALEGDVLTMAKNILAATDPAKVQRVIWVTGMGIHHEIKGLRGKMLDGIAKARPEYIEAADLIADSGLPYTLLRCPGIKDGEKTSYDLTTEDTQPRRMSVDRAAIAKCMADMVLDESLGKNLSLGITN